jgi:two-component system response regulator YesN
MEAAQRLLLETNKTINEIASETGYITPQSLIRTFRKESGMTPTEFRTNNNSGGRRQGRRN